MEPFYLALSLYKRRKLEECTEVCTGLLDKNPYDQAVWTLKMKALTAQVMVDDIEAEEEGIADSFLDSEMIAQSARPGTSLRTAAGAGPGPGAGLRPVAASGRAVSGVLRPATQTGRATSLEAALRTPRSTRSARPVTAHAARSIRLGTASMLSQPDGPFVQVSRLNLAKYAAMDGVSKLLFQYIYYHENDVRNALDLAVEGTRAAGFRDPWWKVALGKCYAVLGLPREAEAQFKSALRAAPAVDTWLRLANLYLRIDQPLNALETCTLGLAAFPREVTLATHMARVLEALNNMPASIKYYRDILKEEAINVEAIACIGLNYFYSDQPEVALRFYRRLLEMGLYNAELFNNIALCCYYAQHYDMVVTCFQRALSLAVGEAAADVWFNVAHVAIGLGELRMGAQCLRLALAADASHAAAYNNLAVVSERLGPGNQRSTQALLQTAAALAPFLFEPAHNMALLATRGGSLEPAAAHVARALAAYPAHVSSARILHQLELQLHSL